MSYAYNGQCSSICDAICDRTGVARGLSFGVGVGGRREGQRKKCALVIWLLYELGGGKFEVSYTYNGE